MKNLIKLSTALTIAAVLVMSACKKTDSVADKPAKKTDYEALSKQIATSFYNSLNTGSTGFKTSGTAERRTNSTGNIQCGQVEVTPTNWVTTSGDTTRVGTGNSVFTYICNDFVLNEYSLSDTLSTKETRPGFESIYTVAQRYNTRATDISYLQSVSNGKISVGYYQRYTNNNGVTTEQLNWTTHYNLVGVLVNRTNDGMVINGGQATFTSNVFHKDNVVDIDGWSDDHFGYITFQGNDVLKVAFGNGQGFYSEYLVNIKTGVSVKL